MGRVAILQIRKGTLGQNLEVSLQVSEDGKSAEIFIDGLLPENPQLKGLYECWRSSFCQVVSHYRYGQSPRTLISEDADDEDDDDIKPEEGGFTSHRSHREEITNCRNDFRRLETSMQAWLEQPHNLKWQKIRERLYKELGQHPNLRLVIQSDDPALWKLPWLAWDLLQNYPNVGIAFSHLEFEPPPDVLRRHKQVRILAVFGNSHQLDLEADRREIQRLKDAEIVFLDCPNSQSLIQTLREEPGWDIFFFAGHSRSQGGTGRIEINNTEGLDIDQFHHAVREAIGHGLKIAIFNSCDGLGLAQHLKDLRVTAIVAMQEIVLDVVAQSFFKEFLQEYSGGQSLYAAVRRSQERLEAFTDLPGATALPIVVQHPAKVPPTWEELRQGVDKSELPISPIDPNPKQPSRRQRVQALLAIAAAVTAIVMGVRWWGKLQAVELLAFDLLMRQLPSETADPRLLIVGINEADIRKYTHPLPDDILAQLLQKLRQQGAAAIGLDIIRDKPVPQGDLQGNEAVVQKFRQNPDLIGICAFGNGLDSSIAHLPEIPQVQTGFADLHYDNFNPVDYTVRRYLLARTPNPDDMLSLCHAYESLALKLVDRYFKANQINVDAIPKGWKFGSAIAQRLQSKSGGYQALDARGDQLMIRYRKTEKIAQEVSVRDVLEDSERFNPEWVKDRIVLIGMTAPSVPDIHDTPYGKMRGVSIHGHVISQLLSMADSREHRAPIWYWTQWGDLLWVFFWSLTGGLIIFQWQISVHRNLAIGFSGGILYGMCWWVLTQGGWMPMIPAALALLGTGVCVHFWISACVLNQSSVNFNQQIDRKY